MSLNFPTLPDEVHVSEASTFFYQGRKVEVCVVVDIDSECGVLLSFMYEVDEEIIDLNMYLVRAEMDRFTQLLLDVILGGEKPSEEFKELVAKMLDLFFEKRVLS